jgi:hypothetical protein
MVFDLLIIPVILYLTHMNIKNVRVYKQNKCSGTKYSAILSRLLSIQHQFCVWVIGLYIWQLITIFTSFVSFYED